MWWTPLRSRSNVSTQSRSLRQPRRGRHMSCPKPSAVTRTAACNLGRKGVPEPPTVPHNSASTLISRQRSHIGMCGRVFEWPALAHRSVSGRWHSTLVTHRPRGYPVTSAAGSQGRAQGKPQLWDVRGMGLQRRRRMGASMLVRYTAAVPAGTVCKTVGLAYVGSNPTPATRKHAGQTRSGGPGLIR
jgi:hypothetical protein